MKNVAVIGAQWGDEGKGKVVDILAPFFDVVVRYNGGHNAGHTVRTGDRKFVLHLIPSGILHPECACVIGNGTVIDPAALKVEIEQLEQMGVSCVGRLIISDRAHLILPYHVALEAVRERSLGANCVGTTMRGIGPAYEDKAARRGIRAGDLHFPELFREKALRNVDETNRELASMGAEPIDRSMVDDYLTQALEFRPFIRGAADFINSAVNEGKALLLEGAQATMLDIDHGTYPFVTSSNSTAGGASTGTGLAPQLITGTLGLAKAYTTRVGAGPFPTELLDDTGAYLQRRGNEFGASTGRPRRTGWFDAVVVRYSNMINRFDALAVPKLDVLDEVDELRICTAYKIGDTVTQQMPYSADVLAQCEPVYETLPGWKTKTSGITSYDHLPANAKHYVKRIEELVGAPVALISSGPEREETIIRDESAVSNWMRR
ncbi:MAG TPA: adenylosuccinate synthase [Blastocatellia bacterium]|nr:adenylosuccinate synthase [Blastocatellia bacterium]